MWIYLFINDWNNFGATNLTLFQKHLHQWTYYFVFKSLQFKNIYAQSYFIPKYNYFDGWINYFCFFH